MQNNQYLSVIAFMDDDASAANEQYLYEFCKICLFQNGYKGLTISELRYAINQLVPFDYTEEDIERVINNSQHKDIVRFDEQYQLESSAAGVIESRDKSFPLRRFVDDYCDKYYLNNTAVDRSDCCNWVTKFLFEKFQESVEQIISIIDLKASPFLTYSEDYSDDARSFINGFLAWDNAEKNEMIYKLIVKSYDYCMINCPQSISFDFSSFRFYLDANIIMRLMGINNSQRQEAVKRFVDKCRQVGIELYVSCFTKTEIEKSIDRQLKAIELEMQRAGRLQPPQTVLFGFDQSFSIDLYRQYYDFCISKNTRSLNGFRLHVIDELNTCISAFNYDEDVSYEAINPSQFHQFAESLKQYKDDPVVKTDVNNVMMLVSRREMNKDTYMISADAKLIRWCKEIFVGQNSYVEFPSAWLSIIMKYTGRVTQDDFSAFCRFIRLPILSKDKDIKKKVEMKSQVEQLDLPEKMKDRIIDELNNDFDHYAEFVTPGEAAQKAYENLLAEQENKIRSDERSIREKEVSELKDSFKRKMSSRENEWSVTEENYKTQIATIEADLASAKSEGQANSVSSKITNWVEAQVNKSQRKATWIKKHRSRLWIYCTLIIFVLVAALFVFKIIQKNLSWIEIIVAIIAFVSDSLVGKIIDALIEHFGNEDELRKKYTKKSQKRFRVLL